MLQVYCKTNVAILLLGVKDERGIMRFPSDGDQRTPGLRLDVRPLLSINEQLVDLASKAVHAPVALSLAVVQEFADELALADDTPATVYLATLDVTHIQAPMEWPSMPEILRGMGKDRRRLPYLRAWQILTGGLQLSTKAIEFDEAKKHLEDS